MCEGAAILFGWFFGKSNCQKGEIKLGFLIKKSD
jgi:hypothetical protein